MGEWETWNEHDRPVPFEHRMVVFLEKCPESGNYVFNLVLPFSPVDGGQVRFGTTLGDVDLNSVRGEIAACRRGRPKLSLVRSESGASLLVQILNHRYTEKFTGPFPAGLFTVVVDSVLAATALPELVRGDTISVAHRSATESRDLGLTLPQVETTGPAVISVSCTDGAWHLVPSSKALWMLDDSLAVSEEVSWRACGGSVFDSLTVQALFDSLR